MNESAVTPFETPLLSTKGIVKNFHRHDTAEAVSYITNGVLSALINCIIMIVARLVRPYGKQILLLSALAFSVFLVSCGYFADGVRRAIYYNDQEKMTIQRCFLVGVHLPLFYVGETAESSLLLYLSFDRFLAMIWPTRYIKFNYRLTKRIVVALYGLALLSGVVTIVIIVFAYGDQMVLIQCYFGDAVPKSIRKLHNYWYIVSGFISIITYIAALVSCFYRRRSNMLNRSGLTRREVAVTQRVALIIVATFLSGILPLTLLFALPRNRMRAYVINWIMSFHSILLSLNVLVYACLLHEFRNCLLSYIICSKPNRVGTLS